MLVTGAAGGVGSIAVALLANLGYRVAAVTGRANRTTTCARLGAATIVARSELETPPKGPLAPSAGPAPSTTSAARCLGNLLAALCYWGSCASVGNAAGIKFEATVIPFLLRGINLLGIDSATCPYERRMIAWPRLARELPMDKLDEMSRVVPLSAVPEEAGRILKGQVRGRTVIEVGGG